MSGRVYLVEDNAGFADRFCHWWDSSAQLRQGYEVAWASKLSNRNAYAILQDLLIETKPVVIILDYHLQPLTEGDANEILRRIRDADTGVDEQLTTMLQQLQLGDQSRIGLLFLAAALANPKIPRVAVIQVSASGRPIDWNGPDDEEGSINALIQWAKQNGRFHATQSRSFKFFSSEEFSVHYDRCMRWLRQGDLRGASLESLLEDLSRWRHSSTDNMQVEVFTHCGDHFWQFMGIAREEGEFLFGRGNGETGRFPFADGLRGFGDADPPGFNIVSAYLCALAAHRAVWPNADWRSVFKPEQAQNIGDIRLANIATFVNGDRFWSRAFTRAFFEMCLRFMDSSEDTLQSVVLETGRFELAFRLRHDDAIGLHQTLLARRKQLLLLMRHHTSLEDSGRILPGEDRPGPLGHDRSYWIWEVQLMRMLSRETSNDVAGRERTSFEVFLDQNPPSRLIVRFQCKA